MTVAARELLKDAHIALQMLEEEENADRWRVVWFAAIAMTRAIGHVLKDVDCANDIKTKREADKLYMSWHNDPEHQIFSKFIKYERDLLLKENITSAEGYHDVYGVIFIDENGNEKIESIESILYRPILNGHYAGNDARDVLAEALQWWSAELDKIDQATAEH